MVTEIAYITVDPDRDEEFIAAVGQAAPYFKEAEGCHGMRLERVIEDSAQFRLSVDWESVDHHMVTSANHMVSESGACSPAPSSSSRRGSSTGIGLVISSEFWLI